PGTRQSAQPKRAQVLVPLADPSNLPPREVALGTIAQLVPPQSSTSVPLRKYPTAKQLVVLVHDTPYRGLLSPVALGLGLGTIAQLVPSRRSTNGLISVSWAPRLWPKFPTARQLVVLVPDTSTLAETSEANFAAFPRTP